MSLPACFAQIIRSSAVLCTALSSLSDQRSISRRLTNHKLASHSELEAAGPA